MVKTKIPQLIALDLDETTLNQHSRLSESNRDALAAAVKMGIILVIASGRAFDTLPREMCTFPGVQYAICGNGAAIYTMPEGNCIRRYSIPEVAVHRVLCCAQGEKLTFEAFVSGCAYAQWDYIQEPGKYMTDPMTSRYVKESRRPVENIQTFILEHITQLDSLDLVVGDLQVKERMMQRLCNIPGIYITTSVPRLIEISHMDCGKHRGLEFLSEYLQLSREEICAFGNADNDADMLKWAGMGIAVSNGSPACLSAADYITEHYMDDGVAKALAHCFGIYPAKTEETWRK